jgi:hypothetical protein
VTADPAGLSAGTYTANIAVFGGSADVPSIAVTFTVRRNNNCSIPPESPSPHPLPAGERTKVRGKAVTNLNAFVIVN